LTKRKTDVLVIGGGVIGLCSAYCLAQQGLKVSLVEQAEIASGCSAASAGLIVPSYSIPLASPHNLGEGFKQMISPRSPFYLKLRFNPDFLRWLWQFRKASRQKKMLEGLKVLHDLNYASLELFDQLVIRESLSCNYQKKGWLFVYRNEKSFQKGLLEAKLLDSFGVKFKILNKDEVLEMEPALLHEIWGGIFFPEDAHLDPIMLVKALAARLKEKNVSFHINTKVVALKASKDSITTVRTTKGDFRP